MSTDLVRYWPFWNWNRGNAAVKDDACRYFCIADIGQVDVPVLLIVTLAPLLYWSVLEALIITVISEPMVISSLQRVTLVIKCLVMKQQIQQTWGNHRRLNKKLPIAFFCHGMTFLTCVIVFSGLWAQVLWLSFVLMLTWLVVA